MIWFLQKFLSTVKFVSFGWDPQFCQSLLVLNCSTFGGSTSKRVKLVRLNWLFSKFESPPEWGQFLSETSFCTIVQSILLWLFLHNPVCQCVAHNFRFGSTQNQGDLWLSTRTFTRIDNQWMNWLANTPPTSWKRQRLLRQCTEKLGPICEHFRASLTFISSNFALNY